MSNFKVAKNLDSLVSSDILPVIGFIMPYAGDITQTSDGTTITTTAPDGWLLCNGNTFAYASYPKLYALIGGTLPDLRGRFLVGTYFGKSSVGLTAGAATHAHNVTGSTNALSDFTPAPHTHNFPGYTVAASSWAHNHTMSGNLNPGANPSNANVLTSTGTANAMPSTHTHPLTGNTAISGSNTGNITHDHDVSAASSIATVSTPHTHIAGSVSGTGGSGSSIPQSMSLNFIIKADR
jgi:microcystin-dependent protein